MAVELVRSRRHRMIAEVCGGIAEKVGRKPSTIRWLFVLSCILPGPQFLIYIVLWVVLPEG